MRLRLESILAAVLVGCSAAEPTPDAGVPTPDAGESDAGIDAGESDAGLDAGETDAGVDAGESDAGIDAGEADAGWDAGSWDAGPLPDAGPCGATPADAGTTFCRIPAPGSGCNTLRQAGTPVAEMQVSGEPPTAIGGWYPAGTFVLSSSTLYTPACGVDGPTGISYAATIFVSPVMEMPSVDRYQVVQAQAGCPDVTYNFAGDTFGYQGDAPFDHLSFVEWTCPPCPTCSTKMKYSGTTTTFTIYLPAEGGATLVQEFTLAHT